MKKDKREGITALDIQIPASGSKGTAYFRITPEFRDFLQICQDKHGIVGFEYDFGELNFGVILGPSDDEG